MLTIFGVGRVTNDFKLNTVTVGEGKQAQVCEFDVACRIRDKKMSYVRIEIWSEFAVACAKYLKKGSLIAFNGEGVVRNYTRSDGSLGTEVKIINPNIDFLDTKEKDKKESKDE